VECPHLAAPVRIFGSALAVNGGMCSTTKTAAAKSAGNAQTTCFNGSTPPAKAPSTMTRVDGPVT
jgi:hypothetical protein